MEEKQRIGRYYRRIGRYYRKQKKIKSSHVLAMFRRKVGLIETVQ
jgi:hypothetical protein